MTGIWTPWQTHREEDLEAKDIFLPLLSCLFFLLGLTCALNTSWLALIQQPAVEQNVTSKKKKSNEFSNSQLKETSLHPSIYPCQASVF